MPDILKFPGVPDDPDNATHCDKCGAVIPPERLEIVPGTKHCVGCSDVKARRGFMESGHAKGTGSEITIVDGEDAESLRRAKRANSDQEFGRR